MPVETSPHSYVGVFVRVHLRQQQHFQRARETKEEYFPLADLELRQNREEREEEEEKEKRRKKKPFFLSFFASSYIHLSHRAGSLSIARPSLNLPSYQFSLVPFRRLSHRYFILRYVFPDFSSSVADRCRPVGNGRAAQLSSSPEQHAFPNWNNHLFMSPRIADDSRQPMRSLENVPHHFCSSFPHASAESINIGRLSKRRKYDVNQSCRSLR